MIDINEVITVDERNAALSEIGDLRQKMYKVGENVSFDQKTLDDMEAKLRSLKVLNMTIATDANSVLVKLIHRWVRTNLGSGIILDIEYDKSLLAGAKIEFNGKYVDISLARKLEQYFSKGKS